MLLILKTVRVIGVSGKFWTCMGKMELVSRTFEQFTHFPILATILNFGKGVKPHLS